jgi:phospholipid/cholesterol/gamma-HCH transport system permease protein
LRAAARDEKLLWRSNADRAYDSPRFCAELQPAGWSPMATNSDSLESLRSSGAPDASPAGLLAGWRGMILDAVAAVGDFGLFTWQTMSWLCMHLPRRRTVMPILYQVGVSSLPVVALTGTFIGMVLAVETYYQFRQLGLETRMGGVINKSLACELGPVLAATMLAGRVGGAIAAELGTMRITEQIDALASMGADPIHYLVVPRFLAFVLLIPALTVMAVFMGVLGGFSWCVVGLGIDYHHYLTNAQQFVGNYDLFSGMTKSIFFAVAIALVSCYQGFNCLPGAEGVGKAATSAFVQSFVLILGLDLLLGIVLNSIYFMLWPEAPSLF